MAISIDAFFVFWFVCISVDASWAKVSSAGMTLKNASRVRFNSQRINVLIMSRVCLRCLAELVFVVLQSKPTHRLKN